MKKILPLFLAVVLAVAMSVPAFATEHTYNYAGYELSTLFLTEGGVVDARETDFEHLVLIQSPNVKDGQIAFVYSTSYEYDDSVVQVGPIVEFEDAYIYVFDEELGAWSVGVTYTELDVRAEYVYWTLNPIYDANGGIFMQGDPAFYRDTDADTGTNTTLPDYPSDWNVENYPYAFMLHDASTGVYYFYGYGKKMTANTDGSISLRGATFGIKYTYNPTHPSGNPWADYVTLEVDAFDVVTFQNTLTLVWSNYDILYEDGTNFFPVTPIVPSQMSGVITEAMMVQVVVEILTILPIGLACGITYLALRKGLAILRETLSRA